MIGEMHEMKVEGDSKEKGQYIFVAAGQSGHMLIYPCDIVDIHSRLHTYINSYISACLPFIQLHTY